MRAASTAWMLAGSSPSSWPASTATSCSTNSGLPSARCGDPRRRARRAPRRSASSRACASASASSTSSERLGCGAAHAGRGSSSSGRVRQTSRIGDPLDSATTWSSRSSSAGCGPVDVLDGDDERALARDALEQPPQRPRGLVGLRGLVGQPDRAEDPADRLLVAGQQLLDAPARGRRRARARSRRARGRSCPRRRPGSGRRARSPRRRSPTANSRRQARLADARRARDRHEPARTLVAGAREGSEQRVELARAADERRRAGAQQRRLLDVAARAGGRWPGRCWPRAATRLADALAEQDLAVRRALGEPPGGRDRARPWRSSRRAARRRGRPRRTRCPAAARTSAPAARRPRERRAARRRRETPRGRRCRRGRRRGSARRCRRGAR